MIDLYTGTPGSGKSLHLAERVYDNLFMKRDVIVNFPVTVPKALKGREKYLHYIDNSELTVSFLVSFALLWSKEKGRYPKENEILLIIDECQIMFNAREWGKKDRSDWLKFFTQHRKLGYHIILVAQFDMMIDKQIRALVEYQYIHRKVSKFGWKGILICCLLLAPRLFIAVQIWYPMREKVGSSLFRFHKKYAQIYDTRSTFDIFEGVEDLIQKEEVLDPEIESDEIIA